MHIGQFLHAYWLLILFFYASYNFAVRFVRPGGAAYAANKLDNSDDQRAVGE